MIKMNDTIKQRIAQLNNGEVPNGYEKTEFGVFPCDWVKDNTLNRVCQINPKTNCLPKQFIYLDLESVQDRKIIQRIIIDCKMLQVGLKEYYLKMILYTR